MDALHPTTASLAREGDGLLVGLGSVPDLVRITRIEEVIREDTRYLRFTLDEVGTERPTIDMVPTQPIVILGYWATPEPGDEPGSGIPVLWDPCRHGEWPDAPSAAQVAAELRTGTELGMFGNSVPGMALIERLALILESLGD